jgi:hypothetical protein
MQDDPNTDTPSEHPRPDAEDWEIAFEPYKGHPGAALQLGFLLIILRSYLSVAPYKIDECIDALDLAVDVLFPHTEFHLVSQELFLKVIEGTITREEEQLLNALGIRF